MRTFLILISLIVSTFAWSETVFVRARWMIDVETGKTIENPVIVVEQDKIKQVGDSTTISIPGGATVLDWKDSFLLPGLVDAHVHLAWSQQGQTGIAGAEDAQKTLLAGFTTVRNPGSTGNSDVILRDAIESGKTAGPRMFVSGPALGAKQGVCDQVFAGEGVVNSKEEVAQMIEKLSKLKVDWIKFCAGGQVVPSQQDLAAKEFEDSMVQAIVTEAKKHQLRVAAHAQGPDAIVQSVKAGVNSIEHGGMINREAAELMKKNGTYLVPTLYRLDWILENAKKSGTPAATLERFQKARDQVHENMRQAIALGVPIAFGTDATVYPHGLNAREFSVLVQLGMTPLQAIQTATIHAANLLGQSEKIGRIQPGFFADFIGVAENPLNQVSALENVPYVMKAGRVHSQKK